jgi:hypothetical protein
MRAVQRDWLASFGAAGNSSVEGPGSIPSRFSEILKARPFLSIIVPGSDRAL